MTSCKLLIYYPEDFRIFSGALKSADPLQVSLQGFDKTDLESSICMKLKWYHNSSPCVATVSFISESEDGINLNLLSKIEADNDETHFIAYRSYLDFLITTPLNIGDMRHKADKINNRHKSTLGTQIQKILTDETLTNQYLFKLLMQVDAKLDELLDNIKQDETIEGLERRNILGIGGGGLTFVYDDKIAVGDTVFVQSLPKNGLGVNFAALCKITDTIKTPTGYICESDFDYIDENTRETVIHFIFQKDREKLKRTRI